jgi:DNA-binding transcriptional regulator YhcF (GntR family)
VHQLTIDITIDHRSPVAPFEQVRVQIRDAVRSGSLPAGVKLPTVRGLAESLGLAANTVARAYRELEADQLIETRGRNGSFVSASGDATQRQAQLAATTYAARMRQLGVSTSDALALVEGAMAS